MNEIDLLILKYLSKKSSVEEQAELLKWLEEKEENQIYFRSLKDTYDLTTIDSVINDSELSIQWKIFSRSVQNTPVKSVRNFRVYSLVRYAAIFLLGVLISYFIYSVSGKQQPEVETVLATTKIETGIGERSKITLPDGSTVWINACSSITFDNTFGEEERAVILQGEAYFDVETDSLKPFLVHTDLLTHRVTGTSFNVYSFKDEVETSIALLEGGVTIEYGATKEKLSPGEVFIHNRTTGENTRERADVNHISSWRYGEFTFDGLTFEELSKRLERMYDVKFVFDNKSVSQLQFGGTLRNNSSLETIMKVIRTSVPIKYTINENTIHIN